MSNALAGPRYIHSILFKQKGAQCCYLRWVGRLVAAVFIALRMKAIRIKHFCFRAQGADNSSGDKIRLEEQTLTKDFDIGTHAGGLFPNKHSSCESVPKKDEVVYQFSNWVGCYSASEFAKMQSDDPDIGIVLNWKLQSDERPSPDIVAAARHLWLQWQQLIVQNGLLSKKWVSVDNTSSYDQFILPSLLRKEVMKSLHNSITSAYLGVHKTVAKVKQNFYWYKMNDSVRIWI